MDLTESIAPKTDQQNFDDYLTGPRTVTISDVKQGNAEQPVNVELAEYPGKPYKPNKSMLRVLVALWGPDSKAYVGRRLKLFGNPAVRYGGKAVGGIEIEAMSHIDKPKTLNLTETRGKKRSFTVQPLADVPAARDFLQEAEAANGDKATLRALWTAARDAKEPQAHLDTIAAMVAPDVAPAA